MTTPIILFSDHPASFSGLGRITRDIATGIATQMRDVMRVATLGHGAPGSLSCPFFQYSWRENDQFLPLELPFVWRDFVGEGEKGVLMTIGDIQRFLPLADGKFCPDRAFAEWISIKRSMKELKLWGYFPIDAHNMEGKLGHQLAHTLTHYDRVLVPSEWAKKIVKNTLPDLAVSVIPHGIHSEIFHPHPKNDCQDVIGAVMSPYMQWPQKELTVSDDAIWIGIVATNQWRKDWALGMEVVKEVAKKNPVMLWCHVDRLKNEWSILELLDQFDLLQHSMVTVGNVSDDVMSICYSAMDLTLGIGRGEGFGYPIFESIFSGTPCYAGEYGAHSEYMAPVNVIPPVMLRMEGPLGLVRPVYDARDWADRILQSGKAVNGIKTLDWLNVWPKFEQWIMNGVEDD